MTFPVHVPFVIMLLGIPSTHAQSVLLNPTGSQTVTQPTGTSLNVVGGNGFTPEQIGGVLYVGYGANTNIQTTVNAACAMSHVGRVIIPPTYAGTDGYTNQCASIGNNSVTVMDYRPITASHGADNIHSVYEWGAKCDGATDDTTAITAALNAGLGNYTVSLPQGTCLVTGPIITVTSQTNHPSLVGLSENRSIILANYASWGGSTTAPGVIEINTTSTVSDGAGVNGRNFRDFTIDAENTSGYTGVSTGINVRTTASGVTTSNVDQYMPLYDATIQNIQFFSLGQPVSMTEAFNTRLVNLGGLANLNGIYLAGEVIQCVVDKAYFGVSTGGGTGFEVTTKSYTGGTLAPQAVVVSGSAFVSYATDADIEAGLNVNIDNTVLDGATGETINVVNPNNFRLTNDYLYDSGAGNSVVAVNPGTNVDGLWIKDNLIIGGAASMSGINFAAGATRRGVHIEGNRINGTVYPIFLSAVPTYSTIRDNYGQGNSGNFISLNSTGTCGTGLYIDGNMSSDDYSILSAGCAGFTTGFNLSASGTSAATTGFSGTKTVGACTLTVSRGIITNVTGC